MKTVLLVEDQDQVRQVVQRMLERSGYQVIAAESADAALEAERRHAGRIEVLLADIVLPGMSGPELAKRINARRIGIRTLYMSGYPDEVVIRHLTQPRSFLLKPFDWKELASRLRELFSDVEVARG